MILAAAFMVLGFTAPGDPIPGSPGLRPCSSYEAEARSPWGSWAPIALSSGPLPALGDPVPGTPGAPDSVWISISTAPASWISGGLEVRIRGVDAAGNRAPWSNGLLAVAGPDTEWIATGARLVDRQAKHGAAVGFRRAFGDTIPGARITHLETMQLASKARLCSIFGFWALRGARIICSP